MNPKPTVTVHARRRTWDIYLVAAVFFLGGASRAIMHWLRPAKAEVLLGVIWIELPSVLIMFSVGYAVYCAVAAVGVFRVRSYGYWMVVALVATSLVGTLVRCTWGREVAITRGEEPAGFAFLATRLLVYGAYAYWCWARRHMYAYNAREASE